MKKIWLLMAVVLLGLGGYFGYKVLSSKPGIEIIETAKVRRGDIRAVLVETGIIKPQVGAQVKIGARATGEIVRMKVKVGDSVRKNELIALIDDREIKKEIDQTKAAIEAAGFTLAEIEKTFPESIKEAAARYEYARITFDRELELIKKEYTTQDEFDQARRQLDANRAIWRRLKMQYALQREIARANLERLQSQLEQQQIRLSYTKIYAPIDGVVSSVTAQEGETIVTGLQVANLVTVLAPDLLEMWIYVDETDVARVKIGQPVEYSVDTYPDKTFQGVIAKNYPEPIVRDNITYYLSIVRISKEDAAQLRPEMTTYVKIVVDQKKDVLMAPNAAVKFEAGRQIAYRIKEAGKTEKIELKIGIRGEDETEILAGVNAGDELATKLIIPVAANPANTK